MRPIRHKGTLFKKHVIPAPKEAKTIIRPTWAHINLIINRLYKSIAADTLPDIIIGVGRGGLIPAVWLSNRFSIPLIIIMAKRNENEAINAQKIDPEINSKPHRPSIKGKDVLIVEDIIGSGDTIAAIQNIVISCKPQRLRTLTCYVNLNNYHIRSPKDKAADYVGSYVYGWVVFPWEKKT